ncbi:hypothetical protein DYB26_004294 [Aphanomyces astaci]|uniref:Rab-GAP TBC domain-containing protein n=1 Tax=Aphanomyces astaci TaxID=112090 RepID=A0A3R7EL26_APHAT|nr:hypothetical protein DYB26_004294 [Aphanomyces astaci]
MHGSTIYSRSLLVAIIVLTAAAEDALAGPTPSTAYIVAGAGVIVLLLASGVYIMLRRCNRGALTKLCNASTSNSTTKSLIEQPFHAVLNSTKAVVWPTLDLPSPHVFTSMDMGSIVADDPIWLSPTESSNPRVPGSAAETPGSSDHWNNSSTCLPAVHDWPEEGSEVEVPRARDGWDGYLPEDRRLSIEDSYCSAISGASYLTPHTDGTTYCQNPAMNGVEGGSGGGPNDGKFVYAEGTVDEKVGFIFDRMKESSFLGDCRNKLKSELKRQLNNMDDDDEDDFHVNLTYMMQRLGLVHAIKTFVMDIHTEGTKDKRDFGKQNAILVTMDPDRRETLDAIEVARKAWEAFTTDALREYVRQTAMPLVVHHQELAATKETSETSKPHVASQFLFSRQYAKTGSPITLRPHVNPRSSFVAIDPIYFKQLEAKVKASTVVTDGLFMLDVQQTTDSSDYFPFEDHLRSVMLAFSRDEQVVASQAVMTLQHPVVFQSNASCSKMAIPPANVMPFHGLVMFVAPLCYLYDDPVHVYFVFRDMYCRYWCQLTGISARPNAILALCKTFETLIHRHIPAVVQHLLQVLLLWDRVVGYDSLEIIAIFAAALFTFRSHELLQVTKIDDVKDLFTDALEIQVMPILQQFLFPIYDPQEK